MDLIPILLQVLIIESIVIYTNGESTETSDATLEGLFYTESSNGDENQTETVECTVQELNIKDVYIFKNGNVRIKDYNLTFHASQSLILNQNPEICFRRSEELNKEILDICDQWEYDEEEFSTLDNGSVLLHHDTELEPGTYKLSDGKLIACAIDYIDDYDDNSTQTGEISPTQRTSAHKYIGQIGCSISLIALIAHLITFCLVPSLRTLPGYNLASLSMAFLLGYAFVLIGQISGVRGIFCVVSAILQYYSFLVAFFCMSTIAYDVWRSLKIATTQLIITSQRSKRRRFILYCIYSWCSPLPIIAASVVMDNKKGTPRWSRPEFGKNNICWMTNNSAKIVFFVTPAFCLLIINVIFFVLSAFIIRNNSMRNTSDEQKQTARLNFLLYLRLGLMMGVTWLVGFAAAASKSGVMWVNFDVLNSLQGLFLFLLFSCSRKVYNKLAGKVRKRKSTLSPKVSACGM